jgi:hypothetical protein
MLTAAIGVVEARAQHDTPVRDVFVRVGELDGRLYLDLADAKWRAIEIDKTGWRVVDRPAVRFRRTPDMRALPEPKRDGSVDSLRPLLNIPDGKEGEADFILAAAYALTCLRGRGPYPVMAVSGEQGSAKSTRSAMLRNLVDPGKPTLRALPRDEHDLVIAARNRHVLAFDNVSGLKWWLSDALCRIASGAGFGARTLYSDDEETVFEGARPLIVNGIEDAVERPDSPSARYFRFVSRSTTRTGSRRKRFGRLSMRPMHPSLARCSMRRRRALSASPRSGRRPCRAWQTSPTGRSPVSRRCGMKAPFSTHTGLTSSARSRASLMRARSRLRCAS